MERGGRGGGEWKHEKWLVALKPFIFSFQHVVLMPVTLTMHQ